jgi:Zn-finger nucleic acid-binding protein
MNAQEKRESKNDYTRKKKKERELFDAFVF